jgi:tRNA acetyltransferase TAN1
MKLLLQEVGVTDIARKPLSISGLVLIRVPKNPIEIIRDIRGILQEDPWRLKVVYKIKPLEIMVDTRLDLIGEAVDGFVSRIQPEESFKIELKRRYHKIKSTVLIAELAQRFENPVDLENPNKILLVEVLGSNTGIAICLPTDILSLTAIRNGSKI